MRPREPNAEECVDILEDIRRHFVNDGFAKSNMMIPECVYNEDALHVLSAWLRHKICFPPRDCAHCGKPVGPNPKAIYCGTNCRTMAYHQREREKRKPE